MNPDGESFADALVRVELAVHAVYAGTSGPFADLWSRAENSSLFGAFGPAKRGWEELQPVFPWVASRYHDGEVAIDYVTVVEGVDIAYTVGYEHAVVSIDGGDPAPSTIRVTHVFRREEGRWLLMHRHGDFAPTDDSPDPVPC
jgi:ketosteroid isomerase-like protein